jgi:hypothetical protein
VARVNNIAKGGIIVGGAVGGVLLGQWVYKEYFTVGSNNSVINNAVGAVANTVAPRLSYCTVPNVMVGFPVRNSSGELTDGPRTNNNMDGIRSIAMEVFGDMNSANIACAFASCECMDGDLHVNCGSCSLFNIHHGGCNNSIDIDPNAGSLVYLPATYIGRDKVVSFINGATNQVQGFRRSMAHFNDFIQRRCPNAIEYMRQGNFEGFQIEISRIGYATSYTRSVSGNTVTDPFIRARFNRLVRSGLLSNS